MKKLMELIEAGCSDIEIAAKAKEMYQSGEQNDMIQLLSFAMAGDPLTKEQAQKILKDGVDEYGIFYSVYTWTALTYFVADMWNRNPIYKCIKK